MADSVYNDFAVTGSASNTGYQRAADNNETVHRTLVVCPPRYYIATKANALLEATWDTAMKAPKATRIYKFPLAVEGRDKTQAATIQNRPLAGDKKIRAGKPGIEFVLDVNAALLKKLRTFNTKAVSLYLGDENGNIKGWTDDGAKFRAFTVQEFFVDEQPFTDGSKAQEVVVFAQFATHTEWNDKRAVLQPSWDINQKDGVNDVIVTVTGATTAGYTISVMRDGIDNTDPAAAVTGCTKPDFVTKKSGVVHSITGAVTDNGDGTYTVVDVNSSGSFTTELVACASISLTDEKIEGTAAASWTI